jgi:hypothetical protein
VAPGVTVQQVAPGRPQSAPAGFRFTEGGALEPIPGGPQDPRIQPLTEAQGRSNMFGAQMQMGNDIIRDVGVPSAAAIAAWRAAPEVALNPMLSPEAQQYFNAVRLFAAGILRKETGAAFTTQELLDVQSRFFPMPGDSASTREQKARARQQAINSITAEIPGGMRGVVTSGPGNTGVASPPGALPPLPPGFELVR